MLPANSREGEEAGATEWPDVIARPPGIFVFRSGGAQRTVMRTEYLAPPERKSSAARSLHKHFLALGLKTGAIGRTHSVQEP